MRFLYAFFFFLTSCATRYTVPVDYAHKVQKHQSRQTVVFFLIDGLSVSTLESEVQAGHLPHLRRHFLENGGRIHRAHSIFPSLTYPNISSLLHEKPVHRTGALGNTLILQGKVASFESVLDRPLFSHHMDGGNVFTRLAGKGANTVSLDYGLGINASVASSAMDLEVGLALELQDYLYLDQKRIDSLELLLAENPASEWPEFVFIHLVGFDFLSHQRGAGSKASLDYLKVLDSELAPILDSLKKSEDKHRTISILSADHGFSSAVQERLPLEKIVASIEPRLKVFNEGRMAAIYDPMRPTESQLAQWSGDLLQSKGIDLVGYRVGTQVHLVSRGIHFQFGFQKTSLCSFDSMSVVVGTGQEYCPDQLPPPIRDWMYPYLIENLAFYFQAEKRPDLVVIPKPKTVFDDMQAGYHGGPTGEEIFTPLLLRNAALKDSARVPAIWELLQFQ